MSLRKGMRNIGQRLRGKPRTPAQKAALRKAQMASARRRKQFKKENPKRRTRLRKNLAAGWGIMYRRRKRAVKKVFRRKGK